MTKYFFYMGCMLVFFWLSLMDMKTGDIAFAIADALIGIAFSAGAIKQVFTL